MNARSKGFVRLAIAGGLVATAGLALAVRQPAHIAVQDDFTMADGSEVVDTKHLVTRVPAERRAAWEKLQKEVNGTWQGFWDPARRSASQLFGPGIPVQGAVADPAVAEREALAFVRRHIELLAPGAAPSDLVVVDNRLNPAGDLRYVGFEQQVQGMPVLGGGMGVSFKSDRLFFVTVDTFPNVRAKRPDVPASAMQMHTAARAHIASALGLSADLSGPTNVLAGDVRGPFVLPIARGHAIHKPAAMSYETVYAVAVDTRIPVGGGWDVYVTPRAQPVAARRTTFFADGTVAWELGKRRPGVELQDVAASNTDTSAGTTDAGGIVDVGSGGSITLETSGPLVSMRNNAGSDVMSSTANGSPGAVASAETPQNDIPDLAVFTTFAYANFVKEYTRERLNPNLGWLDQTLSAQVNISQSCNAYYDGGINMFSASNQCENTGVLADVVIHEFGHGLHGNSLMGGVRRDGALGEAHGDILAMTIAGKANMGEGFFKDDPSGGMRELDPPDTEKRWPDDRVGQVHADGEIYGGTAWDLRKALVAVYGEPDGVDVFNRLWYATVQRAGSIPDTYGIILSEDDDDGDLSNGTPHLCLINKALDPHGLVPEGSDLGTTPSLGTPVASGLDIEVPVTVPDNGGGECEVAEIASAKLIWTLRGDSEAGGEIDMTNSGDSLAAAIPPQDDGSVVLYQIEVTFDDGTDSLRPRNPADRWYQMYVGRTSEIYCADFESDDGAWTFGADEGQSSWEIGAPAGNGGDPAEAFDGSGVLGTNLDGEYGNNSSIHADLTVAGVEGHESVRLQFRRWLRVEDGFYDQASILVNDQLVWANLNSDSGRDSNTHHEDYEWRFHDVDLTDWIDGDEVTIRFQLDSDQGLELGGWNLDEVCVVAYAAAVCGDGYVDTNEECDDGNDADGDGCSSQCTIEPGGGDGDGDGDGSGADGDEAGGCCGASSSPGAPAGSALLALGVIALLRRRRARTA